MRIALLKLPTHVVPKGGKTSTSIPLQTSVIFTYPCHVMIDTLCMCSYLPSSLLRCEQASPYHGSELDGDMAHRRSSLPFVNVM